MHVYFCVYRNFAQRSSKKVKEKLSVWSGAQEVEPQHILTPDEMNIIAYFRFCNTTTQLHSWCSQLTTFVLMGWFFLVNCLLMMSSHNRKTELRQLGIHYTTQSTHILALLRYLKSTKLHFLWWQFKVPDKINRHGCILTPCKHQA